LRNNENKNNNIKLTNSTIIGPIQLCYIYSTMWK